MFVIVDRQQRIFEITVGIFLLSKNIVLGVIKSIKPSVAGGLNSLTELSILAHWPSPTAEACAE